MEDFQMEIWMIITHFIISIESLNDPVVPLERESPPTMDGAKVSNTFGEMEG
jgi:hypothetical protein